MYAVEKSSPVGELVLPNLVDIVAGVPHGSSAAAPSIDDGTDVAFDFDSERHPDARGLPSAEDAAPGSQPASDIAFSTTVGGRLFFDLVEKNPSLLPVVPGAAKVTRSDTLAICLHEMKEDTAGSTKSTVWKQNNTHESALDKRIVLLLPETLTMSEWRSLRECNVGTKAAYDFPEVRADSDTVGKLLQTGSSKGQPFVLAAKLNEIDPVRHASLQACLDRGLVSCELHGDAHNLWQLTPHGKSMLRSSNQLEKGRAVLQPLPPVKQLIQRLQDCLSTTVRSHQQCDAENEQQASSMCCPRLHSQ